MKLSELNLDVVTKAVNVYLDCAYGKGSRPRRMPDLSLDEDAPPTEVLSLFQRDKASDQSACVRYSMRLGNRNYPFMKLLLQEHIMVGEYYFAVDTHDDMDIKPDYPDYEAWMAVRRFNQELKRQIESRLAEQHLHTASVVRDLVCERATETAEPKNAKILVVDDEEDLAEAVESLLRARGYTMHKVHDGRSAVRAAHELHPDLIILDYELPEMDGLEVLSVLREQDDTRTIPVLLCTASRIGVGDIRKADGFLAKPYQEELLYEMVNRVMSARRDGDGERD